MWAQNLPGIFKNREGLWGRKNEKVRPGHTERYLLLLSDSTICTAPEHLCSDPYRPLSFTDEDSSSIVASLGLRGVWWLSLLGVFLGYDINSDQAQPPNLQADFFQATGLPSAMFLNQHLRHLAVGSCPLTPPKLVSSEVPLLLCKGRNKRDVQDGVTIPAQFRSENLSQRSWIPFPRSIPNSASSSGKRIRNWGFFLQFQGPPNHSDGHR